MWDAINQYLFKQFKNITEVQAKLAERKLIEASEKLV
jgi:hypothetical protein